MKFLSNLSAPIAGATYMIIGGAIYAIINVATQYLTMNMGLASTNMAFWQYFIALVAMLPWLFKMGVDNLKTDRISLQIVRVIFSALGVQCWIYALANGVPIWQAISLLMTSPFFIVLGAKLILGESVGTLRLLATLTGFVGGMIILKPWSDTFSQMALLPIAAAAFWAGASLIVKRLSASETPASITMYLLLLLTPINAALLIAEGITLTTGQDIFAISTIVEIIKTIPKGFVLPAGDDVILLLGVVGILTAIAQGAFVMAYKVADAAYVQPFDHVKLPLNVLAGALVFGWTPPGELWLGAAIIIGAALFITYRENQTDLKTVQN